MCGQTPLKVFSVPDKGGYFGYRNETGLKMIQMRIRYMTGSHTLFMGSTPTPSKKEEQKQTKNNNKNHAKM